MSHLIPRTGSCAVSGDAEGRVHVLRLANGDCTLALLTHSHKAAVNCLSYSPDGTVLSVGLADGQVLVYDAEAIATLVAAEDNRGAAKTLDVLTPMASPQIVTSTPSKRRFQRNVRKVMLIRRLAQNTTPLNLGERKRGGIYVCKRDDLNAPSNFCQSRLCHRCGAIAMWTASRRCALIRTANCSSPRRAMAPSR